MGHDPCRTRMLRRSQRTRKPARFTLRVTEQSPWSTSPPAVPLDIGAEPTEPAHRGVGDARFARGPWPAPAGASTSFLHPRTEIPLTFQRGKAIPQMDHAIRLTCTDWRR